MPVHIPLCLGQMFAAFVKEHLFFPCVHHCESVSFQVTDETEEKSLCGNENHTP